MKICTHCYEILTRTLEVWLNIPKLEDDELLFVPETIDILTLAYGVFAVLCKFFQYDIWLDWKAAVVLFIGVMMPKELKTDEWGANASAEAQLRCACVYSLMLHVLCKMYLAVAVLWSKSANFRWV